MRGFILYKYTPDKISGDKINASELFLTFAKPYTEDFPSPQKRPFLSITGKSIPFEDETSE